jgi:hypothetical protein
MLYRKPTLAFSALRHCLFTMYDSSHAVRNMAHRVCTVPGLHSSGANRYFIYYEIEAEHLDNASDYLKFLERRKQAGGSSDVVSLLNRLNYAR